MSNPEDVILTVPRTAHYAVLEGVGPETRELWYVCHGYGQLARTFVQSFASLVAPHRAVIAPEGLSRFYLRGGRGGIGASWMTSEGRLEEIEDYLRYLDHVHRHIAGEQDPGWPLTVLGFSQGAATAMRWAARGSITPWRIVLWGAVHPPDLSANDFERLRRLGATIVLVAGQRDKAVPTEAVAKARRHLEAEGLPVELMPYEGGHEIVATVLQTLIEGALPGTTS